MARRDYGFLRSFASIGSDPTQFNNLRNAGYGGVLIDYSDPKLAEAVAAAKQAGIGYGFWGDPAHVGNDNAAYVSQMQQLNSQYHPDMLVPDLEFAYRGEKGSTEWNRMADLAKLWQQSMGGARTAIAPMGSTYDMHNYDVADWGPNTEWMPQAYGANPNTDLYDPNRIVQTLVDQGVDPSMISPILGPGHVRGGQGYGGSGLWTIDDFFPYGAGGNLPKASAPVNPSRAGGGSAAPTRTTTASAGAQPRQTQTRAQVASSGLSWGGQQYANKQDFARFLQSRGRSYGTWASQHPNAAAGLAGRK